MIEVRKFEPVEGDMLYRSWVVEGVKRKVWIPPYAIVDLEKAKQDFEDYTKRETDQFLKNAIDYKASLLRATYSIAVETLRDPQTVSTQNPRIRTALTYVLKLILGSQRKKKHSSPEYFSSG